MSISNYPNGFITGVLIRGLMRPETTTGTNFYVGNHSSLLVGERSASDGNKGDFLSPFATIDKAINSSKAGNGDRIYVRPGHTESITAATTLVPDINGVQIVGLGHGEDRPILTYTTAAAAALAITADNFAMANIIHKCNIASQNHMLDLTGAAGLFVACSFREGTQTGLSFVTADGTDADIDRTRFVGCDFYAPTAGNYDNAIQLAKDFTNVQLIDCYAYGDFDVACVDVPAGGNAQVNLQIRGGEYTNLLTTVGSIVINGTGSSGTISDVLLKGDTEANALDNGSLAVNNVRWASITTDQVSSTPIFPEADSASNILGANDSNNLFDSSSVVANADGSIIERQEYIQTAGGAVADSVLADTIEGAAASTQSVMSDIKAALQRIGADNANNSAATTLVVPNRDGSQFERLEDIENTQPRLAASSTAVMVNNDDIFTISGGMIVIESLVSVCISGNDGTASTLQYEVDPTTGAAVTISAASASLAAAAAGATVSLQGTALSTAALLNASGGNLGMSANGLIANVGVISLIIGTGSTTGTWAHYLRWRPLQSGAAVVGI